MQVAVVLDDSEVPTLKLIYSYGGCRKEISFQVPYDFYISSDSLAALALVCRPKHTSSISFDFPITQFAESVIVKDYGLSLSETRIANNLLIAFCSSQRIWDRRSNHRSAVSLNFSGGVDSLAAHYLCSASTHGNVNLISLDFGDRFKRESNFFEHWDTRKIKTNFRDKPFDERVDWRFMASGSILFSDYLGLNLTMFGTILEASPFWFTFRERKPFEESQSNFAFRLSKLKEAYPVVCLSEYGTTLMASKYGSQILERSIESAADRGSSKYFRKLLLKKIVLNEVISESWAEENRPKKLNASGTSFADDILAMYFAHKFGIDFVDKYILNLNESFIEAKSRINMRFFERYNQCNIGHIPLSDRSRVVDMLRGSGLREYDSDDVDQMNRLIQYLARFHF